MDHNQNIMRKPVLLETTKQVWSASNDPESNQELLKCPTDAAFIREDVFAVADSEQHALLVYHARNAEEPTPMKPDVVGHEQVWPNSVAVVQNETLVVTDRKSNTVKFFDVNTGQCVHTWARRHMDKPHGVAVTNRGLIVVTDIGSHTFNVLSPEGHLLARKGTRGSDIQQLNLPFYCAVDKKDNIIISDNMNYSLKIFDEDGNFKRRIGSGVDWGRRQFLCPYGVTVDPEGNILAADNENHKVFMFNSQGKFLKHLLVRADCYHPSGVAMGPCGNLVVTESSYDHVGVKMFKVYDMPVPSPVWHKRTLPW